MAVATVPQRWCRWVSRSCSVTGVVPSVELALMVWAAIAAIDSLFLSCAGLGQRQSSTYPSDSNGLQNRLSCDGMLAWRIHFSFSGDIERMPWKCFN
jgi:hypothetical protein